MKNKNYDKYKHEAENLSNEEILNKIVYVACAQGGQLISGEAIDFINAYKDTILKRLYKRTLDKLPHESAIL